MWPMPSFIVGLHGNINVAQQYMNIWAIERDVTMDCQDVFYLVATAFLEYANINLGIINYHHLAIYFGDAMKNKVIARNFPLMKHKDTF